MYSSILEKNDFAILFYHGIILMKYFEIFCYHFSGEPTEYEFGDAADDASAQISI